VMMAMEITEQRMSGHMSHPPALMISYTVVILG
jgi:hypothetical protein